MPHDQPPGATGPALPTSMPYSLRIVAYGQLDAGTADIPEADAPEMKVEVGNPAGAGPNAESWLLVGTVKVTKKTPTEYAANNLFLPAGRRAIRISFTNDFSNGSTQDRNLVIRKFTVTHGDIYAGMPADRPNNGSFALQSISVLGGFFGNLYQHFPVADPCSPSSTGCQAIAYAKAVGASDVTITTTCSIPELQQWCDFTGMSITQSEQALGVAIRYARSLGMSVTVKPFVLYKDAPMASGGFVPTNPAAFFQSLTNWVAGHARIAKANGASLLMLGAEMGGLLTASEHANDVTLGCTRWHNLITAVKSAANAQAGPAGAPTLKYSYSATAGGFWNNLQANEAAYLCFWDKLDYIGVNGYPHFNFSGVTKDTQPNPALMPSSWDAYRRMFDAPNDNATDCDDLALLKDHSGCDEPYKIIRMQADDPALNAAFPLTGR